MEIMRSRSGAASRGDAPAEEASSRPFAAPDVDIYEGEEEVLVVVDLPGVSSERLRIDLDKGLLTIEGKRSEDGVPGKSIASEVPDADYRKSFLLPHGIDEEKLSAELANGVLRIRMPKAAAHRPRQIPILNEE